MLAVLLRPLLLFDLSFEFESAELSWCSYSRTRLVRLVRLSH